MLVDSMFTCQLHFFHIIFIHVGCQQLYFKHLCETILALNKCNFVSLVVSTYPGHVTDRKKKGIFYTYSLCVLDLGQQWSICAYYRKKECDIYSLSVSSIRFFGIHTGERSLSYPQIFYVSNGNVLHTLVNYRQLQQYQH